VANHVVSSAKFRYAPSAKLTVQLKKLENGSLSDITIVYSQTLFKDISYNSYSVPAQLCQQTPTTLLPKREAHTIIGSGLRKVWCP